MRAILTLVIVGLACSIGLVALGLVWRKTRRAVNERYHKVRHQAYSDMIDDIIAGLPHDKVRHVVKQPGDNQVVEELLESKLSYLKGRERSQITREIDEMEFPQQYLTYLTSDDPVKRARALQVLGDLRLVGTTKYMLSALGDDDQDVRLAAARGLASIVHELQETGENQNQKKFVIESLVALLDEPLRWPSLRLAEIIAGVGPEAVEPLVVASYSDSAHVRATVADILSEINDLHATEALIKLLADPETNVRARAAGALGNIGDRRAVEPLIKALDDPSWPVRARAAKALAKIGDPASVWPISQLLKDREWWVRHNAGYALAVFGESGLEALERNINNPDRFARERAVEVLEENGRVRELINSLSSDNVTVRQQATGLLAAIAKAGAIVPLIDATKEIKDQRMVKPLVEVWLEVTESLAENLNSTDRSQKMQAIELTQKVIFSFVGRKIKELKRGDGEDLELSVARIDRNLKAVERNLADLRQDVDPVIRTEAGATLDFIERA